MATERQKRTAGILSENIGLPVSKAMKMAGYSDSFSEQPQLLTNSKGFRELADKIGLTDDYVFEKLKEDIEAKPMGRSQELALLAKIRGMLTDKVQIENKVVEQYAKITYDEFSEPEIEVKKTVISPPEKD